MTYCHAIRTDGGYIGIVTSDPAGEHRLYESATVCPTEELAEVTATYEFWDAIDLARFESPEEALR
jgi:hypothetical protein